MAKIKRKKEAVNVKRWWGYKQGKPSYTAPGNVNWKNYFGNLFRSIS